MKLAGIITIFSILNPCLSFLQKDSSGIYFTADDYTHQKLSYAINCKTQKHAINPYNIFFDKYIIIKHEGIKHKELKDSVYAIKYCDQSITRIYNRQEYPLINPGEQIMIYISVSGPGSKGETARTTYFFSVDAKSELVELTIYNIKAAFPDNHKFHDMIDMEFFKDDDLIGYDDFHKMMKINRVLLSSLEK